jgi:small-conductance mechanosensitive channel
MLGWIEICLLFAAGALLISGLAPLAEWRRNFDPIVPCSGGAALLAITALFPRPGNVRGQHLFAGATRAPHLMAEQFGIAWWILGACVVKSLLGLILGRTMFPDDNEPHARRLFADLASVLVYVVALVGIMETVFKQPISAVLATSSVLATGLCD